MLGCQQDFLREGRAQLGLEAFSQLQEEWVAQRSRKDRDQCTQLPLTELPFAKTPCQASHTRI